MDKLLWRNHKSKSLVDVLKKGKILEAANEDVPSMTQSLVIQKAKELQEARRYLIQSDKVIIHRFKEMYRNSLQLNQHQWREKKEGVCHQMLKRDQKVINHQFQNLKI